MKTTRKHKKTIYLDSFSSSAVDLKKHERTDANVILALLGDPRVSTFDMSENLWLVGIIHSLKERKLITEEKEAYPWHRYKVTKEGQSGRTWQK